MRIILAHNFYKQQGGEDIVFESEKELLRSNGHEVIEYTETNHRINEIGYVRAASTVVWSGSTYSRLKKLLNDTKPDIAHFHNTFIMISPSAYYACKELSVPIVQSLHNYRLFCVNALFFRDGAVCQKCLHLKVPLWGVIHKCYRGSRTQSAVVAAMLGFHRLLGTWQNQVDCYIALTEFARQKFVQGGLPANKTMVKPNFVLDPLQVLPASCGKYAIFVGRLAPEKGIAVLLRAWKQLKIPLKIIGDGPLRVVIQEYVIHSATSQYLGHLSQDRVFGLLAQARFTVFTSDAFENFPLTIVESFACGVPVIGPGLGASSELIRHEETGLLYTPGDSGDLAAKVEWLWNHPEESKRMGRNARREYEQKYTPERNYQMLMNIYQRTLENQL